jgi:hypothetical protein
MRDQEMDIEDMRDQEMEIEDVEASNEVASSSMSSLGRLYTLNSDGAAAEISDQYWRREQRKAKESALSTNEAADAASRRISLSVKNLLSLFDATSETLSLMGAMMDASTTVRDRLAYTLIFKNDADIILVPYQVSVPHGWYYNQAPHILMPGESCVCKFQVQQTHIGAAVPIFSFVAISTDPTRVAPDTPLLAIPVVPFTLALRRVASSPPRIMLGSITQGGVTQPCDSVGSGVHNSINPLRYLAFAGAQGPNQWNGRVPSFGIAMQQTDFGTVNQACSSVIVFTPLDVRA